ncbi:GNAT family N-acetyltransferase [Lysobacter koreensis]|uniref:GNAT family N-acetyltransferase n=1 Tax=Lysobacter koreensis TaxID=266122 RepID=A0ABW2YNQ2_9GAMM
MDPATPARSPLASFDTARLHLRPLQEGDQALYLHLYTDPGVMRHIAAPLSPQAAHRAFAAALEQTRQAPPKLRMWVLHERTTPATALGIVALMYREPTRDSVEIGAMLRAEGQGRGLSVEAQRAVLDHVFGARPFEAPPPARVWSRNAPGNGASIAGRLKLGFVRALSDDPHGEWMRWEMTRARWQALQSSGRDMALLNASG